MAMLMEIIAPTADMKTNMDMPMPRDMVPDTNMGIQMAMPPMGRGLVHMRTITSFTGIIEAVTPLLFFPFCGINPIFPLIWPQLRDHIVFPPCALQ